MPYLLEQLANYGAPLCESPIKSRLNAMNSLGAGDLTHQPKAWQKSDQYMEVMIAGHGILWDFMGFHGILWDCMGLYGFYWISWVPMGLYGISWDFMVMGFYWILWDFIGFHGILWLWDFIGFYGYGILSDFMVMTRDLTNTNGDVLMGITHYEHMSIIIDHD